MSVKGGFLRTHYSGLLYFISIGGVLLSIVSLLTLSGCDTKSSTVEPALALINRDNKITDPKLELKIKLTVEGLQKTFFSNSQVQYIGQAPVPGWYEIITDTSVFYLSHDMRFVLNGHLFDSMNQTDLTSVRLLEVEYSKKLNTARVEHIPDLPKESPWQQPAEPAVATESPQNDATSMPRMNAAALQPNELDSLRQSLREAIKERFKTTNPKALGEPSPHPLSEKAELSPESIDAGATSVERPRINKIGYREDGSRLSESEKKAQVAGIYSQLKEDYTINYPAKGTERGALVVFSDYTCGFCKRLHKDIPALNEKGITVRYLFYPRYLGSDHKEVAAQTSENMRRAWCAPNQTEAMDTLYATNTIDDYSCDNLETKRRKTNPIQEHFILGQLFDLQGTPHSFTNTGLVISGYSGVQHLLSLMNLE